MTRPVANVLVLMGGPDAEHEVSLMSGREIARALRATNQFEVRDRIIGRLSRDELQDLLAESGADVVFPALHGHWGEGGPLQELLEATGRPFVGSGSRAAKLAMNKIMTKGLASEGGIPTPRARQLRPGEPCDLEPPLVLKPVDDGSSVDLRLCHDSEAVDRDRDELHLRRELLMAEEMIRGREITVGILFDEPLPPIEIIPATDFYDYEAKYRRDDTRYVIDPALEPHVRTSIIESSMAVYRRLGCRDLARVDFMVDSRGPWFLEINTMPGFTTHSLVPMAARPRGREMPELCAALVEAALQRDRLRDGRAVAIKTAASPGN